MPHWKVIFRKGKEMSQSKVKSNAKWIILCKIAQSLLQLVVGMLSARYLGPSNYGLINYASSIVAFAMPLMQLGLIATLVNEFIESPESEGKIMGTSLVLELVSSVACIICVGGFVSVFNYGETQTIVVCILYSLSLFFKALELFSYWFQYKLKSKYPSIVMLLAYVIVSVYRIYILMSGKSIYWFAVVNSVDFGIVGIALLVIYHKCGGQKLSFSFEIAKKLLHRSKYYIMSYMMVTIFQNTDHIMLKKMSGDVENGYYTAAITCACVFGFVYTAIIDSMRPVILTAKKEKSENYEKRLSMLYCITSYMGIAQSIVFSVFSSLIVYILYGAEYMAAAPVLAVLIFYTSFAYMGSVRNIWILAEGKQSMLWKINLAGAAANVVLNFILIPFFGAVGAAAASLITQIFINFILGFIIPALRENNRILMQGLDVRMLLTSVKAVLKK